MKQIFEAITLRLNDYAKQISPILNQKQHQEDYQLSLKADDSLLTELDRLLHHDLVALLSTTNVPVISEEGDLTQHTQLKSFWLLDPLDGTIEFVAKRPHYSINIAYIEDGNVIYAWICFPAYGEVYWGHHGNMQALLDDYSKPAMFTAPLMTRSKPIMALSSRQWPLLERYYPSLKDHYDFIFLGAAHKYIAICLGLADLYPRFGPTGEWDTAAGQYLVELLGGRVCDWKGCPITYGKPGFLNAGFLCARSEAIATEFLERLQALSFDPEKVL